MLRVHITTILFAMALMVGCGGNNPFDRSQDPLKDYPSFKTDSPEQTAPPVEPESEPREVQQFLEDTYKVTVKGKLADEPFVFTRGEAKSYEIEVRNLVPDTVFAYEIVGNIDGSDSANSNCNENLPCLELIDVQGDLLKYELKWTPSATFELDSPDFSGRIEMSFEYKDGTSETAMDLHDLVVSSREFAVAVQYSDEPAYIQGATRFDSDRSEFNEADGNVNVDIRIVDPNASSARRPQIQYVGSMTSVDYHAIGFLNPAMTAPELRDGVWVQRYQLNLAGLAAAYRAQNPGATGSFTAGFSLSALSTATGLTSPQVWERTFVVNLSEGAE
ncbi:MAG: hypothetical protein HRT45_13315 [Bdellovibrionales bacterium]|nr:hypothetical protein [Bdellovibrionales bacterium]